jgi:hypothetical protein
LKTGHNLLRLLKRTPNSKRYTELIEAGND